MTLSWRGKKNKTLYHCLYHKSELFRPLSNEREDWGGRGQNSPIKERKKDHEEPERENLHALKWLAGDCPGNQDTLSA